MQSGGQGSQSSANYGGHSEGCNNGRGGNGGRGRGRGGNHGSYNNTSRSNPSSNSNDNGNTGGGDKKQRCQLCFKLGHTVITCWHRFDADFVPDTNRSAAAATATHGGGEPIRYTDTGATDHITGELDKLMMHDRYNGTDQIRTASGAGMDIKHVGNFVIHTPNRDLHLNNVLHVPQATKNLVYVHRFTEIIKLLWNFTMIFSWLRIRRQRKFFCAASVGAASTLSNTPQIHGNKPLASPSLLPQDGIAA
jgi:hypothetical protein